MEPVRVLIVEDDFMVASVHKAFTERLDGFVVCGVAQTGREALIVVERDRPDLVLLDVYLPDISGMQVLQTIRERRLEIDVILITAARDVKSVREAMRGGALHYIVKPFPFAKFKSALDDYVRYRQRLGKKAAMNQAEVDRLYGRGAAAAVTENALPKGLSAFTMNRVLSLLTEAPAPVTAEQVAAEVGVTRVTARRYLEHLAAEGQVKLEVRYGAVGRPEHLYSLIGRP